MIHDFIKMIDNIDFLYGFIYECANLINNLYDYDNYDHLAIKLFSEFFYYTLKETIINIKNLVMKFLNILICIIIKYNDLKLNI